MVVKKNGLSWIVVKDLDKSIDFFTSKVGLTLTDHQPQFGWAELSSPETGAILGVAQSKGDPDMAPGTNAVITYSVDNITSAIDNFRTKGVRLHGDMIEIPGIVKMQTFSDEDGNQFQLVEQLENT